MIFHFFPRSDHAHQSATSVRLQVFNISINQFGALAHSHQPDAAFVLLRGDAFAMIFHLENQCIRLVHQSHPCLLNSCVPADVVQRFLSDAIHLHCCSRCHVCGPSVFFVM